MAAWLAVGLSAQAQVDIFMRIGGPASAMGDTQTPPALPGESTDPQYTNWIPVLSVQQGVGRAVSLTGESTAPSHSEVSLSKLSDRTTPSLILLANGATATVSQPIDYVTIDFRRSGTSQVFYRVELRGVYVTSHSVSSGGSIPKESFSFLYQRIRWSYLPYTNGKAGSVITKGWDVAKNAPI